MCGDRYSSFLSHILKMTPKCAVVAPRVIFVEIDEGVNGTVFRRGLRTMSMLSSARSALLFQHNCWALFANFLLLLVRFSLCVSSRCLIVSVDPRVSKVALDDRSIRWCRHILKILLLQNSARTDDCSTVRIRLGPRRTLDRHVALAAHLPRRWCLHLSEYDGTFVNTLQLRLNLRACMFTKCKSRLRQYNLYLRCFNHMHDAIRFAEIR